VQFETWLHMLLARITVWGEDDDYCLQKTNFSGLLLWIFCVSVSLLSSWWNHLRMKLDLSQARREQNFWEMWITSTTTSTRRIRMAQVILLVCEKDMQILRPWVSFTSPYHILPPSCMSMFMKPTYSTGGCLHWGEEDDYCCHFGWSSFYG
jgi:hypothetical protein